MRISSYVPPTIYLLFGFFAASSVLVGCMSSIYALKFEDVPSGQSYTINDEYKLGPGDRVVVSVLEVKELSNEYTISSTGILPFPLIGYVEAQGVTVAHLAKRLEGSLKHFVKNPKVSVSVAGVSTLRVFFSGQINKSGEISLTTETTLLRGVVMAGGLGTFATGRIILFRKNREGILKRYAVDWEDVLNGRRFLDNFRLENGDIIHAE